MQQLVLLTGFSEYALDGEGQNQLPPYPMSFPCIAFRSGDAELTYPNGEKGHEIRLGHGDTLPESLFSWTGVARAVVTVPDDAVLSDWGQYLPKDERAEITGAWQDEPGQMLEARAEVEDQWILEQAGGWKARRYLSWSVVDSDEKSVIELDDFFPSEHVDKALNLFSSAPELYAALKSAHSLLGKILDGDPISLNTVADEMQTARSALAKAVGKAE